MNAKLPDRNYMLGWYDGLRTITDALEVRLGVLNNQRYPMQADVARRILTVQIMELEGVIEMIGTYNIYSEDMIDGIMNVEPDTNNHTQFPADGYDANPDKF